MAHCQNTCPAGMRTGVWIPGSHKKPGVDVCIHNKSQYFSKMIMTEDSTEAHKLGRLPDITKRPCLKEAKDHNQCQMLSSDTLRYIYPYTESNTGAYTNKAHYLIWIVCE